MEVKEIKEKIKGLDGKYMIYKINQFVSDLYEDIKNAESFEEIKDELENYCCDADSMRYDIDNLNNDLKKIFNLVEEEL